MPRPHHPIRVHVPLSPLGPASPGSPGQPRRMVSLSEPSRPSTFTSAEKDNVPGRLRTWAQRPPDPMTCPCGDLGPGQTAGGHWRVFPPLVQTWSVPPPALPWVLVRGEEMTSEPVLTRRSTAPQCCVSLGKTSTPLGFCPRATKRLGIGLGVRRTH